MSKLGRVLGKELRDKEAMKQNLAVQGVAPVWFNFIDGDVMLYHDKTILYKNTLDGTTLFWNSNNQGNWDEYDWSGDNDSDGYSSYNEVIGIYNPNNTFVEFFRDDYYIDTTNSTGTLDTSAHTYTISTGQQLQSEIFMYEPNSNLSTVKITLYYTGDTPTFEIGSYNEYTSTWNWSTYNLGIQETFLAPQDKHKYRVSLPSGTSCVISRVIIQWTNSTGDVVGFGGF